MNKANYQMVSIQSDKKLIGTNFNGSLVFDIAISDKMRIDNLNECVLVAQVDIVTPSNLPYAAADNSGLTDDPFSRLFLSASMSVNGYLTDSVQVYDAVSVSRKYMESYVGKELSSASPLLPYSYDDIAITGTDYVTEEAFMTRKRNSNLIYLHGPAASGINLNTGSVILNTTTTGSNKARVYLSHDLIFLQSKDIENITFSNCTLKFIFNVNTNFKKHLLINQLVSETDGTVYTFNDFQLMIPIRSHILRPITESCIYTATSSQKMIHNSQYYSVLAPSFTKTAIIYFTFNENSTVTATPRTINSSNASAASFLSTARHDNPLVQTLSVNFLQRTYPETPYSFGSTFNNINNTDILKLYETYRRVTKSYAYNELPLLDTLEKFMRSPVFIFDNINNESNSLAGAMSQANFTINLNNPTSIFKTTDMVLSSNINIVFLYDKEFSITYDESGTPQIPLNVVV